MLLQFQRRLFVGSGQVGVDQIAGVAEVAACHPQKEQALFVQALDVVLPFDDLLHSRGRLGGGDVFFPLRIFGKETWSWATGPRAPRRRQIPTSGSSWGQTGRAAGYRSRRCWSC